MIGRFFLKNFFTPVVCVENDQRVMGGILRDVCWAMHPPPPSNPGQPTSPPPPPRPKKFSHPVGVWNSNRLPHLEPHHDLFAAPPLQALMEHPPDPCARYEGSQQGAEDVGKPVSIRVHKSQECGGIVNQ